jgi:hypothetical protein
MPYPSGLVAIRLGIYEPPSFVFSILIIIHVSFEITKTMSLIIHGFVDLKSK